MATDKLGCTIRINTDGQVEYVEWDDGTRTTSPSYNLKDNPMKDVDILQLESFQILRIRHRSTGLVTDCPHIPGCYTWCPPGAC